MCCVVPDNGFLCNGDVLSLLYHARGVGVRIPTCKMAGNEGAVFEYGQNYIAMIAVCVGEEKDIPRFHAGTGR